MHAEPAFPAKSLQWTNDDQAALAEQLQLSRFYRRLGWCNMGGILLVTAYAWHVHGYLVGAGILTVLLPVRWASGIVIGNVIQKQMGRNFSDPFQIRRWGKWLIFSQWFWVIAAGLAVLLTT